MDQATVLKILQNYGAPPTPENVNRIMSQGVRGDELLSRSMGLQGAPSGGEGGAGMDLMLDKLFASTTPAIQQQPLPSINPNNESNGTAQNGSAPARPRTAPTRPTAHNEAAGNPLQQSGGRGRTLTPNVATATPNNDNPDPSFSDPNIMAPAPTPSGAGAPQGLEWLLAALGLSSAGALGKPPIPMVPQPQLTGPTAPAQITGANPNQKRLTGPNPQLPDESGAKFESGAPALDNKAVQQSRGKFQTPEEVARLKAEVDAENAAMPKPDANARGRGAGAGGKGETMTLQEAVRNFQKMFRK